VPHLSGGAAALDLGAAALLCCSRPPAGDQGVRTTSAAASIAQVLERHADSLMAVPGVVGVAEGLCGGTPCIKVLVVRRTPELERRIPATLEGHPVEIQETGEFRAREP
jgi:hypothetical protein